MCIRDSIYSVLQNGESVCAGYAKTMQYLAGKAGIFVTYVTGTATDPDTGETQDHAWNLVKCDGKYSYVDTTWADPVSYTHLDVYKRQGYCLIQARHFLLRSMQRQQG